ncbi:hypothetical protein DPMN_141576 [Dreissena polymorpha]|uniref:Uncharacterized protein n=1 Tax=Dreissena polymorpha TaxID=45954 RepID=A0A9D4JHT7_DREPO|nr:hypothetical protein DPMN_141576 [Dreissena polymorpha]
MTSCCDNDIRQVTNVELGRMSSQLWNGHSAKTRVSSWDEFLASYEIDIEH